ncbi:MAG: glycerophosphodiester phosphodiesterase [Tessaracoccus sp.]|uniref:glycerophosphodiester phosphodiesterase n=1 Tax=Tessaracoccus sp. TaxID=1971211 RepID=UPI001EBF1D94|nr:glycerophosphodiester phosphodiesterase [Tessaracoccus sp.]MBK7820108.1 glycerophosphodiester phosphodiesterase [Tessaracoccus sp.]
MTTAIWAHRGASAYAPENTIPAFELALSMGADGIELDVQRSADGQVVVIHDVTINRTSNGVGKVVSLSFEELRRCDFSNGFPGRRNVKIPTLREVLELCRPTNVTVNIELKNGEELYPGLENDALRVVRDAGMVDRVVFSSFNHYSLANLRGRVGPENLALLISDGLYDPWLYAKSFGAGAINPDYRALQMPGYVWYAHEVGVKVNAWTVNDEATVRWLASLGVDAVITNLPDQAADALLYQRY